MLQIRLSVDDKEEIANCDGAGIIIATDVMGANIHDCSIVHIAGNLRQDARVTNVDQLIVSGSVSDATITNVRHIVVTGNIRWSKITTSDSLYVGGKISKSTVLKDVQEQKPITFMCAGCNIDGVESKCSRCETKLCGEKCFAAHDCE